MSDNTPVRYSVELNCIGDPKVDLQFWFPSIQSQFSSPDGLSFRSLTIKRDSLTYDAFKEFVLCWLTDSFITIQQAEGVVNFDFPFTLNELVEGLDTGGYDNTINQFYLAPKESRDVDFSISLKIQAVTVGCDPDTPISELTKPTSILLQRRGNPDQQLLFSGLNRCAAFESLGLGTTPEICRYGSTPASPTRRKSMRAGDLEYSSVRYPTAGNLSKNPIGESCNCRVSNYDPDAFGEPQPWFDNVSNHTWRYSRFAKGRYTKPLRLHRSSSPQNTHGLQHAIQRVRLWH